MSALPLLRPSWQAPPGVGALMSLRLGGVSAAPWDSLNVGMSVGDAPAAVVENRRRVTQTAGAPFAWLRQVHGAAVLRLQRSDLGRELPAADAAWTDVVGLACAVQVADCLPVLFSSLDGRAVGAAHAGWRGLAAGVLENTVAALCRGADCPPSQVLAWLGPCIGERQFEVGADVLAAFGAAPEDGEAPFFRPRERADGSRRWLADLPGLARQRLQRAGLRHIAGGNSCTVEDGSRFFSFRRDGCTGRMVAAIWRQA